MALLHDPIWGKLTQRELAAKACVDHVTVGNIKRELVASGEIHQDEAKGKQSKASKAKKKGPKFNADRVTKLAIKSLDKIVKGWPAIEPIAPLVDAVLAWSASRTSNASKVA